MKKLSCFVTLACSALAFILSGCGETGVKPLDTSAFKKLKFQFKDEDPEKNKIKGHIILDGADSLTEVKEYIVYWGNRPSSAGKSIKLGSVSSPEKNILLSLEQGTSVREDYFLLYFKDANGDEHFSQKSLKIIDLAPQEMKNSSTTSRSSSKESTANVSNQGSTHSTASTTSGLERKNSRATSQYDPNSSHSRTSLPDTSASAVGANANIPGLSKSSSLNSSGNNGRQPMVVYIKNVLFGFDQSAISQDYSEYLMNKLDDLENKESVRLRIEGHADERGSNEYNLALGERRAYAVKKFLITMGFSSENIEVVSFGEEKPASRGHNESAWSKNRRAVTEIKK